MFDTERIAIEAWHRAGKACNCEIPESLVVESLGRDVDGARVLFEAALGPSLDFDRARQLRVEFAEEIINLRGVPIKDGLHNILDALMIYSVLKAVATSTARERAEHLLSKANVAALFDAVVCGDEVVHGKPSPDIFLLAAERLHVSPERCLVLEDSESGVFAAARAHMHCIIVPDIKQPSREALALVDGIFPDLSAVATHLKKLFDPN